MNEKSKGKNAIWAVATNDQAMARIKMKTYELAADGVIEKPSHKSLFQHMWNLAFPDDKLSMRELANQDKQTA